MKRSFSFLVFLFIFLISVASWGVCPQDPFDLGKCDTMYTEPWPGDVEVTGNPPYFVRVPIYVTADVVDEYDSIAAFVIPLCYTHTNPTKYCSLSYYYNNCTSFTNPRSIFRHLVSDGDTIHNWMMDQWEKENGEEWDFLVLHLASDSSNYPTGDDPPFDSIMVPPHFFLAMFPGGVEDHRFEAGSRILLATITFKIEDAMSICIDTCFWPPNSRLDWEVGYYAHAKIPRPGTGTSSFQTCFGTSGAGPFQVTSPNGGEEWCGQSTHDITWDCFDTGNVKIEYSTNGGSSWMTITESTPCADEHYPWIVPDQLSSYCKISICDVPQTYCDHSDGFFSIIHCFPGDVNGDHIVDIEDLVYLINYLYRSGPAPDILANGDVNANCLVDVGDVVYLINFLFKNGVPLQVGCA